MVSTLNGRIRIAVGWVVTDRHILLSERTEGNDRGCVSAFSGHIEPGETAEEAVIRELREESGFSEIYNTGITAEFADLEPTGTIFQNNYENEEQFRKHTPYSLLEASLFLIHTGGTPIDTDEMKNGVWYPKRSKDLPIARMAEWDRIILPVILSGRRIVARIDRQLAPRKLLSCEIINVVQRFPWQ